MAANLMAFNVSWSISTTRTPICTYRRSNLCDVRLEITFASSQSLSLHHKACWGLSQSSGSHLTVLSHHYSALNFEKHGAAGVNFLIDPRYYGVWGPINNDGLWRVTFALPVRGKNEGIWSEEEIRSIIPHYFGQMFPGPRPLQYEVVNVAGYKTHQLHAESFRKGRVLLVGDAAHCKWHLKYAQ